MIKKVGVFTGGIILLTLGVIAFNKFSQNSEKVSANTFKVKEERSEENELMTVIDDPIEKTKPGNIEIKNRRFYSDENFQNFLSFTLHNNSDEAITNIMFKKESFDKRTKKYKSDFINEKNHLNTNDSIKFTFKIEFDYLFVHKIRFASGKSVTFDNNISPLDAGDDLVYSDFLRDILNLGK